MTVDATTPTARYTISGIGPYALSWPYLADSIEATIADGDDLVALTTLDLTVDPVASDTSGNLYLTPEAAAEYAGLDLIIARDTQNEQGWVGIAGNRERGLEAQLDRDVMGHQEHRARLNSAVRFKGEVLQPGVLTGDGAIVMIDGKPTIGPLIPSSAEIAAAQAAVAMLNAFASRLSDTWTGDGTTGPFPLPADPISADNLDIFDPVMQFADGDFTLVVMESAPGGKGVLFTTPTVYGATYRYRFSIPLNYDINQSSVLGFETRTDFEAATIDAGVGLVVSLDGTDLFLLARDAAGDWTDGAGAKWQSYSVAALSQADLEAVRDAALAAQEAAETARDDAADEATAAQASAAAAATHLAGALAAEAGAELAAASVGWFPDTATGIAATVDGDVFFAPSGSVTGIYENVSGVATLRDELVSGEDLTSKVDDYLTNGDTGYLIALTAPDGDGDERILGGANTDGDWQFPRMVADRVTADEVVLPGVTLEWYETQMAGGLAIVDPNGVIIQLLGGEEASSGGTSTGIPEDDIRAYEPDIVMDGATDESARLKSAHDAAAADGLRHLYIEGPIYAPTALFLGDVLFLTRSGKGSLVGTYRKRVVPIGASALTYYSGITPEWHLPQLLAKLATATPSDPAVVAYMSDSWGQPNQLIGQQEQFEEILRRVFWKQFGPAAANIRVVNRAIGGTTWAGANGTLVQGTQPWVTGIDLPWTDYVKTVELSDLTPTTRTPDVTMFMFTQNYEAVPQDADIADMNAVLGTILTANPTTDIVMLNASVPSAMSEIRGTKESLEARQSWGHLMMAVGEMRGYGTVDFARTFDALHWGFDSRTMNFVRILDDVAISLPYTFPQVCNDFAFQIFATGATNTFWAQGDGKLTIPLSATPGNALILELDAGGNIAFTIMASTTQTCVARTVSTVDGVVGASTPTLDVSCLGASLIVTWRSNQIIYNGPVERGWSEFTPSISYGGGGTLAGVTLDYAAVSECLPIMPSMTDEDAWGDPTGNRGGNQGNHYAMRARAEVFGLTLQNTRFGA